MLTKNKFTHNLSYDTVDSLLVTGDFIGKTRLTTFREGITQLTVTAREWLKGQYFVLIIVSIQPGVALYSQEQPACMRKHATRIEFNQHSGSVSRDCAIEVGTRFTLPNGAIGLRPCHGDKVTFIQQIERSNDLCDIAGKIHYQAFKEDIVLEPCIEEFRIRLSQ